MKITTNEELWEVLGSLDKFNEFLGEYTEFICRKVMLAVPALVIHHIKNELNYKRIKDKFFDDNPELVKYEPVVAQQLNIVAAENPGWSIEKVFNRSGIEAKKIIKQSLKEKENERV